MSMLTRSCDKYFIKFISVLLFFRKLAFENLLRKYYHQVTLGCGNAKCKNKSCAQNRPIPVSNDEGAAIALQLVKERASLCVIELPKVPGKY